MEAIRNGQGGPVQSISTNYDNTNSDNANQTINKDTAVKKDTSSDKNVKEEDVKKAVDKLNKFLDDSGTYAEYSIHDKFKEVMITIKDKKTGEVIREVPPKKILDMVAKMCEMVGILIDRKA